VAGCIRCAMQRDGFKRPAKALVSERILGELKNWRVHAHLTVSTVITVRLGKAVSAASCGGVRAVTAPARTKAPSPRPG